MVGVDLVRSAVLSPGRTYRYLLTRAWDLGKPAVAFVMLNPSTADERVDDPTVLWCMAWARKNGYGRLVVANLFAFRSPYPGVMRQAEDPVGKDNDRALDEARREAQTVVVGWGNGGKGPRAIDVLERLKPTFALGVTREGQPVHPMFFVRAPWVSPKLVQYP